MKKINIRGIPFDNVTMQEAISLAENEIKKEGVSVVVTPNAEIAQMCFCEREYYFYFNINRWILLYPGHNIYKKIEYSQKSFRNL